MKNSDLKLDADVRSLLERELGADVPDPNSPEFQSFLEELQAERPDLFDDVMRGLQVNVSLPVEQQAQRAEKREQRQATVKRTFFRTSSVDGEPVMAKRRVMMLTLAGLALLFSAVYVLGQILPERSGRDVAEAAPLETEIPEIPSQGVEALKAPEPEPEPEPAPAPPVLEKPAVPLPPPPRETTVAPPAPEPPAPTSAPTAPAPTPAPVEESLPTTLSLTEDVEEVLPSQLSLLPQDGATQAPTELSIYAAENDLPTALSLEGGVERSDDLTLSAEEVEPNPEETVLFDINQATEPDGLAQEGEAAAGQNTQGQPEPELPDLFQAGTRVPAQLITGIAVSQGGSAPIVAETTGDWCTGEDCPEITWIGRATLDELDRVQVTLDQAIMRDELRTARGVALAADFTPGLTAEIRDASASLAQQLLSSSLGGVSDYVSALTNQQKVTVIDGVALSETQVPDVDAFVLGRVASLFSTPQEAQTQNVRVAEVPAGSAFVVLYGVDSAAQGETP